MCVCSLGENSTHTQEHTHNARSHKAPKEAREAPFSRFFSLFLCYIDGLSTLLLASCAAFISIKTGAVGSGAMRDRERACSSSSSQSKKEGLGTDDDESHTLS